MRNNLFPIQASAISNHREIFLITSRPGAGKSALATFSVMKGYKFVADNLCVLKWDKENKHFVTKCHNPFASQWKDTLGMLNGTNFPRRPVRKELRKFNIDLSTKACKRFQPVKAVLYIKDVNLDIPFEIEKLSGFAKMTRAKSSIHAHNIATIVEKNKEMFEFNNKLIQSTDFYDITRSNLLYPKDYINQINNEIFAAAARK